MIHGLTLFEFILYVAPWLLYSFACFVGMIWFSARADANAEKLRRADKEISCLRGKVRHLEGRRTVATADEYAEEVGK